jgi:cytochrome c oxidase cbb3-type subunit III
MENNNIEKDALTGDKYLEGHEYDNIRELDNRLPLWWLWLFIITIVFAVVYVFIYDIIKVAQSQQDEYHKEMTDAGGTKGSGVPGGAQASALTDEASLTAGKEIWVKYCKTCHLEFGQGQVGPNLCDTFAIHGCSYGEVLNTITIGVPEKGMISWKTMLTDDQITKVASFVMTLKGTNPPNPKPPQGEPCK